MRVSISEAKAQLTELVRRAEAGEEVILTRRGKPAVSLARVAVKPHDPDAKRRFLEEIREAARGKATPGPCAARSQDFLYDEDGLPA